MKAKTAAYSKTIYDTLIQAYRPFIGKIMLTLIFGFLGRFLILSNAQLIGQYIDHHFSIESTDLKELFLKMLFLLFVAFVCTLFYRTVFSRYSALAVSRIMMKPLTVFLDFCLLRIRHRVVGRHDEGIT